MPSTQNMTAEERAEDAQLRLDLVLDAAKMALWDMTVDAGDPVSPNNEFIWSPEFRHMLGFTDERDFPNRLDSWSNLLHPEHAENTINAFAAHLTDHSGRTPYDIEYMLKFLQNETGTRLEFEAYDVGHLYTLAYYASMGLVQGPIMVQMVMNTLGGIGPDIDNVVFMVRTAQRLLGDDLELSILGGGRYQFDLITVGALMGCNVRVGMEDNLYIGKGQLAESNAQYVEKARRIFAELSLEVATPDEARRRFGLKGSDQVKF